MSGSRLLAVFRLDLALHVRRPMPWLLVVLLGLSAWGLSTGEMTIESGDTAVGGAKAWITSQFSNGFMLSFVIFLFYSFFVAIVAGLAVVREQKAIAQPVEGSHPHAARVDGQHRRDARQYLLRGLVGERHREEPVGTHVARLDQPRDARGEYARLARTCPGEHQRMLVRERDGGKLLGVE